MNKYLDFEKAMQRLMDEYKEHGKIIVAYDFDDTVCTYTKGNPEPTYLRKANEEICQLLRDLRDYATFIVWTCRSDNEESQWGDVGSPLEAAKKWLDEHEVPYDFVNEDGHVKYGGRKIYANIFLDDRAGLATSYEILKEFLKRAEKADVFNPYRARRIIVEAIREYFGDNNRAIIGMSGGADSTIVAALCVEALGPKRVIGVCMPNGLQHDLADAIDICKCLGIKHITINIQKQVVQMLKDLGYSSDHEPGEFPEILRNNLPALVRRNVLSCIKMTQNGRIMNTTNRTEEFLGYITVGDNTAGDFAPILNYLKTEVIKIGLTYTHIPREFIVKTPQDGMCGKSDEERFGFTYDEVDSFIRQPFITISKAAAVYGSDKLKKMVSMRDSSDFKRQPLPRAPYIN